MNQSSTSPAQAPTPWTREGNKIYAHDGWTFLAEVSTDNDQWEQIANLITAAPLLYNGAQNAVNNWEQGDLAGAIRQLQRIVSDIKL